MVIYQITPGPPLYFKDKEARNKKLQRFSPDLTENYVIARNTFSSIVCPSCMPALQPGFLSLM